MASCPVSCAPCRHGAESLLWWFVRKCAPPSHPNPNPVSHSINLDLRLTYFRSVNPKIQNPSPAPPSPSHYATPHPRHPSTPPSPHLSPHLTSHPISPHLTSHPAPVFSSRNRTELKSAVDACLQSSPTPDCSNTTPKPPPAALHVLLLSYEFTFAPFSGNGMLARALVRSMLNLGHSVTVICAKPAKDYAPATDDNPIIGDELLPTSGLSNPGSSGKPSPLPSHSPSHLAFALALTLALTLSLIVALTLYPDPTSGLLEVWPVELPQVNFVLTPTLPLTNSTLTPP